MSKRNGWILNIQDILRTKDKYELKIKMTLMGLSLRNITSEFKYNALINPAIKTVKNFKLKSSYKNERQ